jgi:biopolymer transport protein ExbB
MRTPPRGWRWMSMATAAALITWWLINGAQAQADPPPADGGQTASLIDFIKAGGWVGHTIIVCSVVGLALVIDAFVHVRSEKLMPPGLAEQVLELSRQAKFAEILSLSKANDSMLGRIIAGSVAQGTHGLQAIREAMQEHGTREITRLQQRVGYMGFIASIAPMLGLLGTVTGMIKSFNVLGHSKGAARPDELARGIAEALVTTCEGLIVAIPLMFFYWYFRDRLSRIGQEAASYGERVLREMTAAFNRRVAQQEAAAQVSRVPASAATTPGNSQTHTAATASGGGSAPTHA